MAGVSGSYRHGWLVFQEAIGMDGQVFQDNCWPGWPDVSGQLLTWMAWCFRTTADLDGLVFQDNC